MPQHLARKMLGVPSSGVTRRIPCVLPHSTSRGMAAGFGRAVAVSVGALNQQGWQVAACRRGSLLRPSAW